MSDALEKLIDQAEATRLKHQLERDEEQLRDLTKLVAANISAAVCTALGLTGVLVDGQPMIQGLYRSEPLRICRGNAGTGWYVIRPGHDAEFLTNITPTLEECLLGYLAELRIELDTAAAADAEIPPALDGPEFFQLQPASQGAIHMMINKRWPVIHLSDVEHGLAGWLNDYVAPIIKAAQDVARADDHFRGQALLTLDDVLDTFKEALS